MKLFSSCPQIFAILLFASSADLGQAEPAPTPYETECVMKSWAAYLHPYEQTIQLKEVLPHPEGEVLAYVLSPVTGEYAKAYIFLLDDGTCFREVVSIGSYAMTAMMHDGPGQLFHADHYQESVHSTLDFFEGKPSYETAKALAIRVLN